MSPVRTSVIGARLGNCVPSSREGLATLQREAKRREAAVRVILPKPPSPSLGVLLEAIEACTEPVPCRDPDPEYRSLWTSEERWAQSLAADACRSCPVLLLCRKAGRGEVAGVWGGQHRIRRAAA